MRTRKQEGRLLPTGRDKLSDFILLHGSKQLVFSLRSVHDLLLYDSGIVIDKEKKDVLHDLKLLADKINDLEE